MSDEFVFGDTDGGVSFDEDAMELTVWDSDAFPSAVTLDEASLDRLVTVLSTARERR